MTIEESEEFLKMLDKVEAKAYSVHLKGWSDCRICGQDIGSVEFEYRNWNWPIGLSHYIEKHLVKPSNEFIKFITIEAY